MRYPVLVSMIQVGETDKGSTAALTIHVISSLLVAWRQMGWKNWVMVTPHLQCTYAMYPYQPHMPCLTRYIDPSAVFSHDKDTIEYRPSFIWGECDRRAHGLYFE